MTVSVLLVDDQPLLRAGFRMILEAEPDLAVVGEASDGIEAVEQAERLGPDVVLMDIRMPRLDGVEATHRLVNGGGGGGGGGGGAPKVLILTTFDLDDYVVAALRAGASGFLLKDAPPERLVDAIRVVASGDAVVAPSVTRRLLDRFARLPAAGDGEDGVVALLTPREREVLTLMARGLSNAEIAETLVVGETTVKTHVGHILTKLGARDRVQAVVMAYESGLVERGQAGG